MSRHPVMLALNGFIGGIMSGAGIATQGGGGAVGNRAGWIYEHDFGSKSGVDIAGSGTASLRVVLRSPNTVITAFPFSP